jgi:DNA-binding SARP family transcriptional activator
MWFALLGPLLVHDGETPVEVPKGRQRVLLAALSLHAGNSVATDALAEVVWDGSLPSGAAVTLRSHVLRLRHSLGPRAGTRLVTRHPGYLLQATKDEVDVLRFRFLYREGGVALREGAWVRAQALFDEALGLWRGPSLADIPSESLRRDVGQDLDALRLQAEEWRIDAAMHLGHYAEVVPGLQSLAAQHPLREGFHGQLMLALYRCGRQAEALAAYQRARDVLVAELGVEPGPSLRDLHRRILSGDPALAVTEPERSAKSGPHGVTPRELPPTVAGFTGRAAELAALTRTLDEAGAAAPGTVVISAIGGTAGVGKTALALHWAHQVKDRFPDGELHVNLRGFVPSGAPATPAEAVRGFLEALGVPPERIPPTADAQAGLYRRLLADRKMLIVLDNARDEEQVRPLLPASPASLVLVTSRNQLAGLAAADGGRLLSLDILTHDEAVQLLTARLGSSRAAAEPGAIDEIAVQCAHLPLALAVAAARAAASPRFPLTDLAAELRDSAGRLDALDAGDPAVSVAAVFSWSYRQLSDQAKRMFRLLGLHPGPDLSVPAAASLAGINEAEARRLLRDLARHCLITEHTSGRYAFHDLLRAYAAGQARDCDSQPARDAAIGRVLDHYLHTASHSSMLLRRAHEPITLASPSPGTCAERPADHREALAWFEAEHQVLLAAVTLAAETAADSHAWQLPWAMTVYLLRRCYPQELVTIMGSALAAATRRDDVLGQAVSLRGLGSGCADTGDYDQARAHLEHCLLLYQRLGERVGEAYALQNLAVLSEAQGRYADALDHGEQALRLLQAIGNEVGEARLLGDVAWFHSLLGNYQRARAFCEQSLALIAKLGGCEWECHVWDTLGYTELHLGNFAQAAAHFESALRLCRDYGFRAVEAEILTYVGEARHATGELPQARQAWQQALAIYDEIQHRDADKVRAKLASTQD